MLKFEKTDRSELRKRLRKAGWSLDRRAKITKAGQLHAWKPSAKSTERRTLRNACRIAGLAE
jgi:hypothetical protein